MRLLTRSRGLDEQGFSLAELTVSLTLLFVVLGVAWGLFEFASRVDGHVTARLDALDGGLALDTMARDVRQASPASSNSTDTPVLTCQPRELAILENVDSDAALERVRYYVQGTQLMRGVTQPVNGSNPPSFAGQPETSTVLVPRLDPAFAGSIFTYYSNGNPAVVLGASQQTSVSAVMIALQTKGKVSYNSYPSIVKVSTWVKLRTVYNALR